MKKSSVQTKKPTVPESTFQISEPKENLKNHSTKSFELYCHLMLNALEDGQSYTKQDIHRILIEILEIFQISLNKDGENDTNKAMNSSDIKKKPDLLASKINFGMAIRFVRLQKGFTQKQLEFESGVNIGNIETGKANPTLESMIKLCQCMEINPMYLFKVYDQLLQACV